MNLSSLRRLCGVTAVALCASATPTLAVAGDLQFPPQPSTATTGVQHAHVAPVRAGDLQFPPQPARTATVTDDGDLERSSAAVLAAGAAATGLGAGAALTLAATRRRRGLALR